MAADAYQTHLVEWGLSAFIEFFENEGINDESFYLLDDETIKVLIPKSGPRLIFKEKYNNLRLQISHTSESVTLALDSDTTSKASTDTCENTSSRDNSLYSFVPDENFVTSFVCASSPKIPTYQVSSSPVAGQSSAIPIAQFGECSSVPPPKKLKITSVFPQGLEAVLNKYPDGQLVLLKKDKLSNDLRTKLTKVIISELFGQFGINDIKGDLLGRVALEIELIFPSEKSETYYIPYDSEKKRGPKGKLYTKFINTKSSLKLANACITVVKVPQHDDHENSNNELEEGYLNFLKIGTEPFTKVLEAWEGSFKLRRKLYLNCELAKIYEDFPCLKLNQGLELIETDFNKRHSDSIDVIYETWRKVCNAILAEVRERKINDLNYANADQSAKTLLLLPYLFSPITIKKSRKGCIWRPSRSEVQESFFQKIENVNELDDNLSTKRDKLRGYGLTVQPFGAVVGDLSSPSFIIIVDEVFYKVDTGLRALELLFKLFHALDIEYPPECAHIWQFLEQAVFKMKVKNNCPAASALLADISYHIENSSGN